ncbi:MAG: hypothetical protein H6Q66_559 [Firmicutes bacterium]|nr:hypothetical protein [Bacillota bacterium]
MKGKHVSIKFCGGCNPRYERGAVARKISERIIAQGAVSSYNQLDADLVIFLSGCSASCADRYNPIDKEAILVADGTVDAVAVPAEKIVDEVLRRVNLYLEKQEGALF